MTVRIASWNVNSLNVRLPHVLQWLNETRAEAPIDVLGIQETKLTDEKFPHAELEAAGWHSAWHGQKTYNGVCLLSRQPMQDIYVFHHATYRATGRYAGTQRFVPHRFYRRCGVDQPELHILA